MEDSFSGCGSLFFLSSFFDTQRGSRRCGVARLEPNLPFDSTPSASRSDAFLLKSSYVSHLKSEGLTSSPLRGLTHVGRTQYDPTWLANREPSSGLTVMAYAPTSQEHVRLACGTTTAGSSERHVTHNRATHGLYVTYNT